jgi:hypothetical protein
MRERLIYGGVNIYGGLHVRDDLRPHQSRGIGESWRKKKWGKVNSVIILEMLVPHNFGSGLTLLVSLGSVGLISPILQLIDQGGWMIRCKRIYNFLCSMLVVHQLLYVLFTLCGIFMHFLELAY